MNKGLFIVFEGIDGCGKTSHIEKLYNRIKDITDKVIIINNIEEGSTTGKAIREMLVKKDDTINDMRISLLYLSELQYVTYKPDGIQYYLDQGYIVICSRWFYSTYAYAGGRTTVDNVINNATCMLPTPDITFYLNVTIEEAMKRLGKNGDFFEKRDKLINIKSRYDSLYTETMANAIKVNNNKDFDVINDALFQLSGNMIESKNLINKMGEEQ